MRRAAAIAAVAAAMVVIAIVLLTRGDDADASHERFVVGSGTQAAVVLRPHDARPGRPVVLFLHGWTANVPRAYAAPRARGGAGRTGAPARARSRDRRRALRRRLAVIGLRRERRAPAGLPRPVAVDAVYPGRDLGPGLFLGGPPLSRIAAGARLLVLASPTDRVVGTQTARSIVAGATQVRAELRTIRDPVLGEHNASMGGSEPVRQTFWAPLDRLLRAARPQGPSTQP